MTISNLQYITNGSSEAEILKEVREVVFVGVNWVQLRVKDQSIDFKAIAIKVKTICANRATFIINDHVEIARAIDADGVHLGLSDMSIPKARLILGKGKIIGGTANTHEDCLSRIKDGADYIGLGPFRLTKTKKKLSPILGINGYQSILNDEITIPVVAIGGIKLEDMLALRNQTKVHGVAVSSLIKNEKDKMRLVNEIRGLLLKD